MVNKLKIAKLAMVFLAVFIASIGLNVLVHELAHFAAADFLGFSPKIGFANLAEMPANAFFTADSQVAYITYSSKTAGITAQDALIAIAGPLANLFIGFSAMFAYFSTKDNLKKMLLILLIVPSVIAFAVNILPFAPNDGFYVWSYFFS